MTESEAIKEFQQNINMPFGSNISRETSELAIQALEEVQQYRAIGTPEELQTMKEHGGFTGVELANIAAMQMKLKEYEAIGTLEELQDMKSDYFEALSDWRQYRKIGTLEECRTAIEKQIPKKVVRYGKWNYKCPCCGESAKAETGDSFIDYRLDYCDGCGQKLDWSDE